VKSNLPYSARENLSKKAKLVFNPVFKLAEIFGFWRYPSCIPKFRLKVWILNEYLNYMYWCYKSAKPIIKSEKGSKLEVYFAKQHLQINRSLLPKGFQAQKFVKISTVGDLMPAKGIENSKDKFYAEVEELIFNADISIANLEFAFTSDKLVPKWHRFKIRATPKHYDAIKGHKSRQYTVFNTANNHITDWGMDGFNTTLDQLEADGVYYVGTNRSPEDQKKGLIITSNGVKFGFVSATYQKRPFPDDKGYQVNFIPFHRFQGKVDVSLLKEQISYCRYQGCDFIIVSLHWGREFEFFPRRFQVDIAHQLIENDADAIISHHNHNIQPFEIYQTQRDPHRKAIVFYGLGNLSSFWSAPHLALSLITNLDVVKGHVNGSPKTFIARVNVTPVLQIEYEYKKTPYLQIEKLSDLLKSARGESRSKYVDKAGQYADLILGKNWRN
jgi:poly-gamma-glutamate synthesis protein (capsule biosynthesis protein)